TSKATVAQALALRATALDKASIDPALIATAPEGGRAVRDRVKPGFTVEARNAALRDVTTALGLDPDNAEARALLARLLTQPPAEAEQLAESLGRGDAQAAFKVAA